MVHWVHLCAPVCTHGPISPSRIPIVSPPGPLLIRHPRPSPVHQSAPSPIPASLKLDAVSSFHPEPDRRTLPVCQPVPITLPPLPIHPLWLCSLHPLAPPPSLVPPSLPRLQRDALTPRANSASRDPRPPRVSSCKVSASPLPQHKTGTFP
ncbi:hypothetical protein K439DRAFT_749664 [Ramaria rubella]|nr:hypothetical protein K439DRAFT_749664 [Ramaria rubella]